MWSQFASSLTAIVAALPAAVGTVPVGAGPAVKACVTFSGPADVTAGMVFIPGATFAMGSDRQHPEERFTHAVRLDGYWIDRHEVTNAQFQSFVAATGYVTLAERGPDPKAHAGLGNDVSGPGSVVFTSPGKFGRDMSRWWLYQKGANWREPEGPGSTNAGRESYPVVHVAYEDALAYARWLGRELPTEAQWEFAARGGRAGEQDWMSAFGADGKPIANTWQGVFPVYNTAEDGYAEVAPAGCFKPNGYGLYDMIGNVWEWTSDWYRPGHSRDAADNPAGPGLTDLRLTAGALPSRVIKGGSYLCSSNYCARYRPTARQPQEVDLSAGHLGFRTVLNAGADARRVRDARAAAP